MEDFRASLKRARVPRTYLSPTRTNNPQPPGLAYQSPLHPNAQYMAIWDHDSTKRKTMSRFPVLAKHLDMVNFSCGTSQNVWPSDRKREPPSIKYSLASTNRQSYGNPADFKGLAQAQNMLRGVSCRPEGASRGIVPRTFIPAFRNRTPINLPNLKNKKNNIPKSGHGKK